MTRFAGSLAARVIDDANASYARLFVSVTPRFGIDPFVYQRSHKADESRLRGEFGYLSVVINDQRIANIARAGAEAHVRMWSKGFVECRIAAIDR
jgi:hypothetical protein